MFELINVSAKMPETRLSLFLLVFFGYSQGPPNSNKLCWAVPALRLPFDYAQGKLSGTAVVEGFRYLNGTYEK